MTSTPDVRSTFDPFRPYAWMVEPEVTAAGRQTQVATVFLTNRECPFTCLMCDLWRYTTTYTVPLGAIPAQLDYAIGRLPDCSHIKLYNAGNFFDRKAIPKNDYHAIVERLAPFRHLIVENHPLLTNETCLSFRDALDGSLEVALGLETIHKPSLKRLNKRMTKDDFSRASGYLKANNIAVRAFVLLWAPFMKGEEGIHWTSESTRFAFEAGADVVSLVPLRISMPAIEEIRAQGFTREPTLREIEQAVSVCRQISTGRLLVDLWEIERFDACPRCGPARIAWMREMNLTQSLLPRIACDCDQT